MALQLWPIVIESYHAPRTQVSANSAGSIIILGGEEQSEQGLNESGPEAFEFQAQQS
jgi:hypothetical protein